MHQIPRISNTDKRRTNGLTYKQHLTVDRVLMLFGAAMGLVLPTVVYSIVASQPYLHLGRIYVWGLPAFIAGLIVGYVVTEPVLKIREWMLLGEEEPIKVKESFVMLILVFLNSSIIGMIFSFFYFHSLSAQTGLWLNPTYWGILGIFALCGNVAGSPAKYYVTAREAKERLEAKD